MPSLVVTAVGGAAFGLALAAPPGPMNAVIAEESVVRGWAAGFRAGLGAMAADACFFLLALAGAVTVVDRVPGLRRAMLAAGAALMLYFAVGAARDARAYDAGDSTADSDSTADPDSTAGSDWTVGGEGRGFRKAFVLALTNPYQLAFWLTVGIGLLEPGQLDVLAALPVVGERLAGAFVVRTGDPVLIAGLFAGIVAWITLFPASLVAARRRIRAVGPAVAWLSAATLAAFAVLFGLEAL
ncbi:MAG: LysE family translocator [Haloarculaceae archaeon]